LGSGVDDENATDYAGRCGSGGTLRLLKTPAAVSQTRKTVGTDPGLLRKPLGQSLFFAKDFLNSSTVPGVCGGGTLAEGTVDGVDLMDNMGILKVR